MRVSAAILLALLAFSASAQGVFKWTDAQGVVHFSDRKPADQAVEGVQLEAAPPDAVAAAPEDATVAPAPEPPIQPGPKRRLSITMYSSVDCGYCARARKYFAGRSLNYAERDISNPQNRALWKQLGGEGVPLFVINGQVSSGFSADNMTQRLQRLGW